MEYYVRWRTSTANNDCGTTIVGFAEDIAIVSVAKTIGQIEEKTNTAIRNVGTWLDEAGLTLAAHKTNTVLISRRKIVEKMKLTVGVTWIESKRAIKYLGVIIGERLNFKKHVKYIGSAIGSLLWNIMYDGVLRLRTATAGLQFWALPMTLPYSRWLRR